MSKLQNGPRLRCFLVGENALALECAKILMRQGFAVLGIYSRHPNVRYWARANNISLFNELPAFTKALNEIEHDLLFSIVNSHILPKNSFMRAKIMAINYHDALLPKYAGVHATAHAILNGETSHGITWHQLTSKIDAGDILLQHTIPIADDDTTASLNMKCFEAGVLSFETLLTGITIGSIHQKPQDLSQRTYYKYKDILPNAGFIDWNQPKETICRLYRASQFGTAVNRFGLLRCRLGGNDYIIKKLTFHNKVSQEKPGTIVAWNKKNIAIVCKNDIIKLESLATSKGEEVELSDVLNQGEISTKEVIPVIDRKYIREYEIAFINSVKIENIWETLFKQANPFSIAELLKLQPDNSLTKGEGNTASFAVNDTLAQTHITGLICAYFKKITFHLDDALTVGFVSKQGVTYPLTLVIGQDDTLSLAEQVDNKLQTFAQCQPPTPDFFARHPEISVLSQTLKQLTFDITIYDTPDQRNILKMHHHLAIKIAHKNRVTLINNGLDISPTLLKTICEQLELFIANAAKQINKPAISIPHLTKEEQYKYQKLINPDVASRPLPFSSINEAFRFYVQLYPNKIAVQEDSSMLTYQELDMLSNKFANLLLEHGISQKDVVAYQLKRGVTEIIAMLGILKCGAVYLPLDSGSPKERRNYTLIDANAKLFISEKPQGVNNIVPVLSIDNLTWALRNQSSALETRTVAPTEWCYIMYSSGTTGQPKGIPIPHQGVVRLVCGADYVKLMPDTRVLHLANPAFDASAFEIWSALLNGGTTVIFPSRPHFDPDLFSNLVSQNPVDIVLLTPSLVACLLGHPKNPLKYFKQIVVGAEPIKPDIIYKLQSSDQFENHTPELIHAYGPTENSVISTIYKIGPQQGSPIPVGKPIQHTRAIILGPDMRQVTPYTPGEIVLQGIGLSSGYLNQNSSTQDQFIKLKNHENILVDSYRTGDLAYFDENGEIYFIGRIDTQVKKFGHRIELAEIERVLQQHPNINECVTILSETPKLTLIAFYTLNESSSLKGQKSIKNLAKRKLPGYMQPDYYIKLDSIPLTVNGKVDYTALDLHAKIRRSNTTRSCQPLHQIASKILQKRIRKTDDFFELGGDSISAMSFAAEAQKNKLPLKVADIFKYPRFKDLDAYIESKKCAPSFDNSSNYESSNQPFNLSPIQKWFFDQKFPKPLQFSQSCILTLNQSITLDKLENSLLSLIAKHDSLRLRFLTNEKQIQQICTPFSKSRFSDYCYLYKIDTDKTLEETIKEQEEHIQSRFNIESGPLVGAVLIIPPKGKINVLFVIHHLVVDLVSWQVLLNDLVDEFSGVTIKKPGAAVSYERWVRQNQLFRAPQKYNLTPALVNRASLLQNNNNLTTEHLLLTQHETEALISLSQEYDIPLHTLLLAAVVHAISKSVSTDRLILHLETHGRYPHDHIGDLSQTVGWFTELTPLQLHWPSDDLFVKLESINTALTEAKNNITVAPRPGYADLSLNYWGNLDGFVKPNNFFQCDDIRFLKSDDNILPSLFDVNAWIRQKQININITFNPLIETIELCTFIPLVQESLNQLLCKNRKASHFNTAVMLDIQKGILHHSLVDDASIYNAQCVIEHTDLKIAERKQAWERLTARIPLLRASIQISHPISPAFKINRKAELSVKALDWRHLSEADKQNHFFEWLQEEKNQPFDFAKQPLFRLHYIRWNETCVKEILTFSHLLLDGWSLMLLLEKCHKLYKGEKLCNPKASVFSYAKWIKSQQSLEDVKFWQDYLNDIPLEPLFRKKARSIQNKPMRTNTLTHTIAYDQSCRIRKFCQTNGITLNVFFQTIFAIVLGKRFGKDDFLLGVTVSGRVESYPDVDDVIGMLSNVLPTRFHKINTASFQDAIKIVQKNSLGVLDHQHNSLHFVRRALGNSTKAELFDAVYAFENYPSNHKLVDNVNIIDSTHYPLVFTVYPKQSLEVTFTYHTHLFETSTILNLKTMTLKLIESVLLNPSRTTVLQQANIKPPHIFSLGNKLTGTLHGHFSNIAKQYQNNIAIQDADQSISYSKLDEISDLLAHKLQKKGINPGDTVALHVKRNTNLIICILGILKSGAIYIPLDQEAPEVRNNFIISHSKASFTITDCVSHCLQKSTTFLYVDDLLAQLPKFSPDSLHKADQTTSAYVIYTSGTTGQPKGVAASHKNVLGLLEASRKKFRFTKDDTWILFHSCAFDVSVWEIFICLLTGGKLTIPSAEVIKDPAQTYAWISKHQVTILNQTPAAFINFITEENKHATEHLPLKTVIFAGDRLNLSTLSGWFSRHPKMPKLVNMYGITETTVHCTYQEITPSMINEPHRSPIGKSLPGWEILILDEMMQPVQPGEVGEIYVGGIGVTQGYIYNEALTSERFIQSPFSTDTCHRLYKSGDMALLNDDGSLDYHGRNDSQVKIRGYRVELYEIEQALIQLPFVKQTKVLCCKNSHGNSLAAYLVMKSREHHQAKAIRQQLFEKLPHYMIPTHIIFLDEFPLNMNGKIDADKLPRPDAILNQYIGSKSTTTHHKLKAIWQQVLQQIDIQNSDDFFDIGGNSFSAFYLLTLINETFNINLPLRFIQECTTIASQAEAIDDKAYNNREATQSLICLKPTGKKPPLFLIHPVGGSIFWFKNLAKYFDDDRPLYAIQDPGLQPPHEPIFNSVEDMAQDYFKLIKRVAPNGPYYIGGASAGATTSIAIADILLSQDEQVNFVGLFDGWVPFPDGLKDRHYFEQNMQRQFDEMKQAFLAQGIQSPDEILALQWQRSQMNSAYKVPLLKQKLTLFKASETIPVYKPIDAPYNYWETRTPFPIDFYSVPGNHESMFFEPNVEKLAECLDEALKKTENDLPQVAHKEETSYSES